MLWRIFVWMKPALHLMYQRFILALPKTQLVVAGILTISMLNTYSISDKAKRNPTNNFHDCDFSPNSRSYTLKSSSYFKTLFKY